MKKINSKSLGTIIIVIVTQIGFVLFEYLVHLTANSNFVPSTNTVLILNVSRILALIAGIGWAIWLLNHKFRADYAWRDVLTFIIAVLLIEYGYFASKLLSKY